MKREISGTSVATAVLLFAAAVLLCTKLQSLDPTGPRLPAAAALLLEALFYMGIISIWRGRLAPATQAVGVPALVALRLAITAAAANVVLRIAGARGDLTSAILSPPWETWATAAAFAVICLYQVRGALPGQARAERPTAAKEAVASKVVFQSAAAETGAVARPEAREDKDEALFQVIEPQPTARGASAITLPPLPEVEGWVTVPAEVLLEQLPPGAETESGAVEIPLSSIVRRLREGELRIPIAELNGVISLPSDSDETAAVVLPLEIVVPQLPEEVLDLRECDPPAWLAADSRLEEIYFAKV